jgi:hypothetical protein
MVANRISSINPKLFKVIPPAEKLNISKPAKPINTPTIFFDSIFALKKRMAITITVKELMNLKFRPVNFRFFFQ